MAQIIYLGPLPSSGRLYGGECSKLGGVKAVVSKCMHMLFCYCPAKDIQFKYSSLCHLLCLSLWPATLCLHEQAITQLLPKKLQSSLESC